RRTPARADSADLIAARALLERFRESAAAADLDGARERLRRIDARRFSAGERYEFLVGLGEALFFDSRFGAAAAMFDSVLERTDSVPPDARELVVDWWASALDNETRPRPEIERQATYQRIRDRMRLELGAFPASVAAAYWSAAAARAQGDLQAAQQLAEAA